MLNVTFGHISTLFTWTWCRSFKRILFIRLKHLKFSAFAIRIYHLAALLSCLILLLSFTNKTDRYCIKINFPSILILLFNKCPIHKKFKNSHYNLYLCSKSLYYVELRNQCHAVQRNHIKSSSHVQFTCISVTNKDSSLLAVSSVSSV